MNLPQSGGALGGCADITALPILESVPNITFLGLGCRIKSAIEPGDLMMGMPGKDLEMLAHNIENMAKPIAMILVMAFPVSRPNILLNCGIRR